MESTNQASASSKLQLQELNANTRKAYVRPVVIDWGTVEELTGGAANPSGDDTFNGSRPV
jgi:hypothetical protein